MRTATAVLCLIVATLLVPVAIAAPWLSLRVDETDAYVDTVAPLAGEPELRAELSDRVAEAAVATIESNLPAGLPDSVDALVRTSTEQVVESPGFPEFWRQANADAHREFLAIVHERPVEADEDGWVIIDLQPLLAQVLADFAEDQGVPAELVPVTPLPLPVVRESKLEETRDAYQLLEGVSLWVPLLWGALVLAAVLLALGWRGRVRAAAGAALGVAVGAGLVLVVTPLATDYVVDQSGSGQRRLVGLVIDVVVASLDDLALTAAIGGIAVAVILFVVSVWPRRSTAVHP